MQVRVNGQTREFDSPMSVAELLERLKYEEGSVAIAVNEEFVPRSAHGSTQVKEGDDVECVAPRQGG